MTTSVSETLTASEPAAPPRESYGKLFLRFLRFGLLAWGGPVAQIAMLRQELVDEERWVSNERFNRILAVYQVLPGPEAHELCVYFGMLARGRLGGFLAGLGFMLPGFVLMFALSWFYLVFGITSPLFQGVFIGFQAAVVALIIRAVHRIGGHALHDRWLLVIAAVSLFGSLLGAPFWLTLSMAGGAYGMVKWGWRQGAVVLQGVFIVGMAVYFASSFGGVSAQPNSLAPGSEVTAGQVATSSVFVSGLRAGLLTFGGAYTAIPILQRDAVTVGGWMTISQFLDGIALGGILPAPLIIFSTFVGFVAGGPWGALAMTFGVFLPAFSFTLVGHTYLERMIGHPAIHSVLDGITAGVVGLIAATAIVLLRVGITSLPAAFIFFLAMIAVYRWKAKGAVAGIVLGAGLLSALLTSFS